MIVLLRADGSTALEAVQDFRRFHCEVDAAFGATEAARKAWAGTVEIESRAIAWVDLPALWALGAAAAGGGAAGEAWVAQARAMADQAGAHGWVREAPPAIKGHLVWRD